MAERSTCREAPAGTMSTKVSIHIPTYNAEISIGRALESVRAQTHDQWEAIVVNDGSTDRTRQVVEAIEDERIKVINLTQNRGRGFARQVALDHSSGDFIAYLDSDDFYHPKKIERQLAHFKSHPNLVACGCGLGCIDSGGRLRRVRGKKAVGSAIYKMDFNFPFTPGTAMIRRDVATSHKYRTNMRLGEDINYFLRVLDKREYGSISEVLYFYNEYTSASVMKILGTYLYVLRTVPSYARINKWYALRLIPRTLAKSLLIGVSAFFLPVEKLIDRRGQAPTESDRQYFREAICSLNSGSEQEPEAITQALL